MWTISLLALLLVLAAVAEAEAAPLWGRWGETFTASGAAAAPETELTVELTAPSGKRHAVSGYWDGGSTWRVRFMPGEEGPWRYRTRSAPAVAGLDGKQGLFECRRAPADDRFLRQGPVCVSSDGRYLQHADGTPFFWLGDTVWNGPLLSDEQSWDAFLRERAAKRFSAIQFVMTAPWRTAPANAEGEVAFTGRERIAINPRFFGRMDERMDAINAHGLLAVPVMLWAIKGDENPGFSLPEDQAIRLARYLRARYQAHHLVWILPGDGNYAGEGAERWKRIGRAVFGEGEHAPVVLHPGGMQWPFDEFQGEAWMDLIGYQSGHGDGARALQWLHSGPPARKWRDGPARPVINLEPPYEDHLAYQSKQPHDARSVRRAAYWSLLCAPTAGLTYGAHGIWSWETEAKTPLNHASTGTAKPWHEAVSLPGSAHMKLLADFFASLPWWQLRPDEEGLLAAQPGAEDPARHIAAARTQKGDVAVLYLPAGGAVTLKPGALGSGPHAEWFDPRTGARTPARSAGQDTFQAPDAQDWVLLLRTVV